MNGIHKEKHTTKNALVKPKERCEENSQKERDWDKEREIETTHTEHWKWHWKRNYNYGVGNFATIVNWS